VRISDSPLFFETEPAGELPVVLIRRKAKRLQNCTEISIKPEKKRGAKKHKWTHTLPIRCARCFAPATIHIAVSSLIFIVTTKEGRFCMVENTSVALHPNFPTNKDD